MLFEFVLFEIVVAGFLICCVKPGGGPRGFETEFDHKLSLQLPIGVSLLIEFQPGVLILFCLF